MEARRGRVEAAVEGDGAGRHRRAQRVEIGVVGDHPPPLEVVEDRGARPALAPSVEYTEAGGVRSVAVGRPNGPPGSCYPAAQ